MRSVPDELVVTRSDRAAADAGMYFDPVAADRVVEFVETYVVPTRGFAAERAVTLMPWQRLLLRTLFGWKKPDGRRRFRYGCLFIPRQNGKSFICSCILLYMLIADDEPGSYCVASAVTGEQTGVVYDEILNSVRANDDLNDALKCVPSKRTIEYKPRNGLLKGLSSEGWGKLGRPPHCGVMDEFCFWRNYKPYEALKTGMDSRKQPLLMGISTSGHDRTTPAHEMWRYAESIRNGSIVDTTFFPALYAAPADAPIDSEDTWRAANPSLGVTVGVEETRDWANRAKHSKTEELQFRQYRLNQWVSSVNQFLNLDSFAACAVPPDQWPELDGLEAYVGVDMAQTRDLCSVVALIPHGGRYWVVHHSFCCGEAVEKREKENLVKYTLFTAEETLTVHAGNIIDFEDVRGYIRKLCDRFAVKSVAFDPREAADSILILLAEGLPAEKYDSGPLYFNTPMRRLESWVNGGKLAHAGDTLIRWQAQNLEAKQDHRELICPKKPDGTDAAKIDTMYALLIAVAKCVGGEAQNQADQINSGPWFAVA